MRVGITGAGGMLGTALIDKLCVENEIYATDKNEGLKKEKVYWSCFDLLDFDLLKKWLQTSRVDVVIHCAAIVDVDMCEAMPKQAEDLHVNSTKIIAEYLDSFNGYLIYISTDLLFDDKKQTPYTEEDITNPLNVYAKTKLDGELVVLGMKNGLVLRTNIIGWSRSSKLSFFEWVLKALVQHNPIRLFDDVVFSPLHVSSLSDIILRIVGKKIVGLYNASSNGYTSKYEFGLIVAAVFDLPKQNIIKSNSSHVKLAAKRPSYMVLSNKKLTRVLDDVFPTPRQAIILLKQQYDNGWLSHIKGYKVKSDYLFWDKQ